MKRSFSATVLILVLSLGLYGIAAGAVPALYGNVAGKLPRETVSVTVPSPLVVVPTPGVIVTTPPSEIIPIAFSITFPEHPWKIETVNKSKEETSAVSSPILEDRLRLDYEKAVTSSRSEEHGCERVHYRILPPSTANILPYEVCPDGYLITNAGAVHEIPDFAPSLYDTAFGTRYIKIDAPLISDDKLDSVIRGLSDVFLLYRADAPDEIQKHIKLATVEGLNAYWKDGGERYVSLPEEQVEALIRDSRSFTAYSVISMPFFHYTATAPYGPGVEVSQTLLLPSQEKLTYEELRTVLQCRLAAVSHRDALLLTARDVNTDENGGDENAFWYVANLSPDTDLDAIRRWISADGNSQAIDTSASVYHFRHDGIYHFLLDEKTQTVTETLLYAPSFEIRLT